MILIYASALLTNLINNTTIAAFFVPILIGLAKTDPSLNAVQLVLPVALATTFGYSLPSASGRMALIAALVLLAAFASTGSQIIFGDPGYTDLVRLCGLLLLSTTAKRTSLWPL